VIGLESRKSIGSEIQSLAPTVAPVAERGPQARRRCLPGRMVAAALALLVTAALALAAAERLRPTPSPVAHQAADRSLRVTVAQARQAPAASEQVLPGNAQPLLEAALYARATGYIKTRSVDIGDQVKEGQVLAVIDAPDVDDQLAQARANLALARANHDLAKANAELARITLERDLKADTAVSFQQLDQDRATVKTTAAQVKSSLASIQVNEAAVQRFTDLQNFQKITAPFAGVITARNVDAGDLIAADSSQTTRELFHLMRTDILRVFVNVPQVYATNIKVGQSAAVYRREDVQKQYAGKVTRTANALDPNTRTLLTEVQVPNPDNALRPGMFLQVKFTFDREVVPVLVPAAALITRSGGSRVALLDGGQRVHYRDVRLGRDFGTEVEVVAGLRPGETVVVRPGDDLPEGKTVVPLPTK
jgi:RND family efflux transporter MFP subunit